MPFDIPFGVVQDVNILRDMLREYAPDENRRPRLQAADTVEEIEGLYLVKSRDEHSKANDIYYESGIGPFVFFQLTEGNFRVRYPAGFHPSNHWKKNRKGLYIKSSRRGGGGKGYGRGGWKGGKGKNYRQENAQRKENILAFWGATAVIGCLVIAFLLKKLK